MLSDSPAMIQQPVDALRGAKTYAEATETPELIETHISYVFLTDSHVYKLKKPVDLGFLDYSTLENRERACRAEVKLNRRLAPDVYLDVVSIGRHRCGRWMIGGDAPAEDWLVKMRRLPEDRCLKQLVLVGQSDKRHAEDIASMLGAFYRGLPAVEMPNYVDRYREHIVDNGGELVARRHELPGELIHRVQAAQLQFLFQHGDEILKKRVTDGHIVEGHGDLRAEHVYMTDPPVVIDGIEFSRELRLVDTADELCFFATTCDHLNAHDLGERVLKRVCDHLDDSPDKRLLDFYRTYRACVRAKVAALRTDQTTGNAEHNAHHRAMELLKLADQYARRLDDPLALIVRGLSGTGKTTLAERIADSIGAAHLATDQIRRACFDGDNANYDVESRRLVYQKMFRQGEQQLQTRCPVVLDGTFLAPELLREAIDRLHDAGGNVVTVTCACPDDVAIDRIRRRERQGDSFSEADQTIYRRQRSESADFPANLRGIVLDTTNRVEENIKMLTAII
ncbi:Cytidylate kinase [Stieleria maiorica]|uniref:Cytidylate kinase n=1 Tax=Stieleria maiorica TaxID=2795974 RepID=A0A5B9MN32_9BACT|nr:bifunctional aminoglycoside phosphotransferase/ATP-binding protein [Stieleria maiorica]QEG01327.1 Cytidylate kinase [Stieleria maiorica]